MKIFGIMTIKNEVDILKHTIHAAAKWCDKIYILDNGSTDGSWELLRELAKEYSEVCVHGQTDEPFDESIRAQIFNTHKSQAITGDWWCRLDADEIYVGSPREFLQSVNSHDVVWAISIQYYFTDQDLQRFHDNPNLYDPSISPIDKLKFYRADFSEPRFFRHRQRLRWNNGAWPRHLGRVYPKRILLRHYKYRSPAQIKSRLQTRSEVFRRGGFAGEHWRNMDLKNEMPISRELNYDDGGGRWIIDKKSLPRHIDPTWKYIAKKIMHGTKIWP